MLAHEIKQYIVDNNLLISILEKLKFHNIKEKNISGDNWICCSWENGDNPNGVQIKKDSLFVRTYTHTNISGDIFAVIGYLFNYNFIDSLKKLHELIDVKYSSTYKREEIKKVDILNPLKKYKSKGKVGYGEEKTYSMNVLKRFKKINWINWLREGISNPIAKEFLICYDPDTERMVLPYRAIDVNGEALVGATGRTLLSHDICKTFSIPKYMCMPGLEFKKTQTLYGYVENYNSIVSKGEVVVGESEKMVLQRASVYDRTVVAVGSHCISNKHKQLLIGLNVDIVIAFDKDVDEHQIWAECEKFNLNPEGFRLVRNIYYIVDKQNLLGGKDAPSDKGNKIYKKLYDNKIKYTKELHEEYLKIKNSIPLNENKNYYTGGDG